MNINQELLKKHFIYNPSTGLFTRKSFSGGKKAGSIAGTIQKDGWSTETLTLDKARAALAKLEEE